MDKKIYVMMNMMRAHSGGLNKAICTRVNMLLNQGEHVEILTGSHNIDVNAVRKELKDAKRLEEKVILRNIYEELAGDKTGSEDSYIGFIDSREIIQHSIEEPGYCEDEAEQPDSYRFYKDGLYRLFKRFENNNLRFIDYFDENRNRIKKHVFDTKGYLKRIEYMDFSTNTPNTICYYNKEQKCFLSIWINPKNNQIVRILNFDNEGRIRRKFNNENEMKKYWIEEMVIKHEEKPIILSDIRGLDNLIFSLENNKLSKIAIMHNNHYEAPFKKGNKATKNKLNLFKNANKLDAIVTLTEQQRDDIIEEYGGITKFVTIPHAAPIVHYNESKREDYTVVSLSRYHERKNVDHIIKAFQYVVKEVPQAKLELWGMGPEEENLKKLINELKLENSIYLKGFANDSISIFERATLSVLTSKHEGFGLVITESMAAGAPVISYDILYGPRDIIDDKVNGIIVESDNFQELANSIIDLLKNPEKRKKMSAEARKITKKFNFDTYTKDWLNLLNNC